MVAGDSDHGLLVAQRLARDAVDRLGAEAERQLQAPVGHLLREHGGAVLARPHAHMRAAAGELRQHRLRQVVDTGREPEPQLAGLAARVAARDLLGGGRRVDCGPGRRDHRGAGLGQLDRRPRPLEQPHAELALEARDLLAERRLGDVQSRSGAAEVQFVRERHERPQEPRVGGHARSL